MRTEYQVLNSLNRTLHEERNRIRKQSVAEMTPEQLEESLRTTELVVDKALALLTELHGRGGFAEAYYAGRRRARREQRIQS